MTIFVEYDSIEYMAKMEEILQNLGLNEKQAIVYINLLQLGKATAYKIAQKSGLKRPTVYVVLDELRLKGLATKVPYPKKQIYIAKHPDELIKEAKDKLDTVSNILPELLALTYGKEKPSVMYFEGPNGIKELLNYGLDRVEGGELIGFYAHSKGASKEVLNLFSDYNNKLKRKNIKIRGFVPEHPSLEEYRKTDKEFGRTMKITPIHKYSSDVSIDIGPNFVRLLMFNDLQGVVIEHKGLATALKQIFEIQWAYL